MYSVRIEGTTCTAGVYRGYNMYSVCIEGTTCTVCV